MLEHRLLERLEQLGPHRRSKIPLGNHGRSLEPDDVAAF